MRKKLREELVKLSTDIIASRDREDMADLYEAARNLYEKLAVLKFFEDKLNDVHIDVSKSPLAAKFEDLANAFLSENLSVPESNPHEEDIMIPGMDTIKHMVSEMPHHTSREEHTEIFTKKEFIKNDKDILTPDIKPSNGQAQAKSINDRLNKGFQIGLNDRLAFVKHLFDNNMDDFNRVISQLNTIETEERSIAFITNMVKPEYNQWAGKEEYEERFLSLITRKFN